MQAPHFLLFLDKTGNSMTITTTSTTTLHVVVWMVSARKLPFCVISFEG
jgi:hypothetical protein